MKRIIRYSIMITVSLVYLFMSISCMQPSMVGTLALDVSAEGIPLQKDSRGSDENNIAFIRVEGYSDSGNNIEEKILSVDSLLMIKDLSLGTWHIQVTGLNSDQEQITGQAHDHHVIIQSGKTTIATFDLLYRVATPVLTPASTSFSASQQVTMSCATSSAVIHYTLDGSTPTSSSPTYSTPLNLTTTTTVTAIAMKNGMADSTISSHGYTLLGTVATPTINNTDVAGGQLVTITSTTNGTTIYYTLDGTTPTSSSPSYVSPFTLTESKTVKAFALKSGMTDSAVVTKSVTVDQVATPIMTPQSGLVDTSQQITISTTTTGATIYYTTDGNFPTTSSVMYTSPLNLTGASTVKAFAVRIGMVDSQTSSANYTLRVDPPVFSPEPKEKGFEDGPTVTISTATTGATIYYTMATAAENTVLADPNATSTPYTEPIAVSETTTIKAVAMKEGIEDSEIVTIEYIVNGSILIEI